MKRILLPVDVGDRGRLAAAIDEAVRIYSHEPVTVHLLNVQPRLNGHVAMFFDADELDALRLSAGAEALEVAKALLKQHNVPSTSNVRIGRRAETIACAARELGCDRIVLGSKSTTGLAGMVFGSLAQQVRHLLGGSSSCQVIGT